MDRKENAHSLYKWKYVEEKHTQEEELRSLWRECFEDPISYENYYFQNVYLHNIVYGYKTNTIQENVNQGERISDTKNLIGMLHLNPYLCRLEQQECILHYIVGVATRKEARRQGVMRKLLCQALRDLYVNGEPLTYLMPANTAYYAPFDFVSISKKEEWKLCETKGFDRTYSENRYVSYEQLKESSKSLLQELIDQINQWLASRYSGFAIHHKDYLELLFKEKMCEQGDIIFCFRNKVSRENFIGFFAYGREEDIIYIEQYISKKDLESVNKNSFDCMDETNARQLILPYFNQLETVKTINNERCEGVVLIKIYPYMVRIVNAKAFIEAYTDCFLEFAQKEIRLYIEDPILEENEGVYLFSQKYKDGIVKKQKNTQISFEQKMTISQLARYVLEKKQLYFSEIV